MEPEIQEINLFAHRKKFAPIVKTKSVRGPQQVTEGPLAKWKDIRWEEQYRRELHRKIVAWWKSVPDGPPYSFKRSKDSEYGASISNCAPERWILYVNASNGKPYSRTFENLFDAFGCAENFVYEETGEIDRFRQPLRSKAVIPIQKCLLQICDSGTREAQTFAEARQRIMQRMR